jgi:two-component system NtrC family sensor kinase
MDARGPQPFAELIVEDTGRGIRAEDLDHLFEPFFTTKGSRGSGLGLAVTWGIVEGHGGSIEVESTVGEGTRFTVTLPCARATVAEAAQPMVPEIAARSPGLPEPVRGTA